MSMRVILSEQLNTSVFAIAVSGLRPVEGPSGFRKLRELVWVAASLSLS
jgi:hypothetical protein